MIDTPPRRHRYRYRYRPPESLPRSEVEARAARVVCEAVGRLLRGRPGQIAMHDLAAVLDAYEQWRAVASPEP